VLQSRNRGTILEQSYPCVPDKDECTNGQAYGFGNHDKGGRRSRLCRLTRLSKSTKPQVDQKTEPCIRSQLPSNSSRTGPTYSRAIGTSLADLQKDACNTCDATLTTLHHNLTQEHRSSPDTANTPQKPSAQEKICAVTWSPRSHQSLNSARIDVDMKLALHR
jgi:hypothetical protein